MEKLVEIEGKKFGLKASAGTVCSYRDMFGRDLIVDMGTFESEFLSTQTLSSDTAKICEDAIWLMAKEYDSSIPEKKEWLDQFSPFFIYAACVHAIQMWAENLRQLNQTKKK